MLHQPNSLAFSVKNQGRHSLEKNEVLCALGLGSNLGNREATLQSALHQLDMQSGLRLLDTASLIETPPWGPVPQGPYINTCCLVATTLSPEELLTTCLKIEKDHGRDRDKGLRWGPRTLDIDLLTYGHEVIDTPHLTIPHPRMLERPFVMGPLRELGYCPTMMSEILLADPERSC
jgi:2-amino-4-hydroxy-6-hydroxymethyldihydropteridine diphosphokinase